MVLKAADLPTTWAGAPYKPSHPNTAADQALAKCVGIPDSTPHLVSDAHSQNFSLGDAAISSQARSYRSSADVTQDTSGLASPKESSCFAKQLRITMNATLHGATVSDVIMKITPGSGGGPSNVVAMEKGAVTVILTATGKRLTLYVDAAFIAGSLIEAEVDMESVGQPVPAVLRVKLIAAVASRVARP